MQRGLNTPTYISQVKYCLKKSVLQPISAKIGIECIGYDLCGGREGGVQGLEQKPTDLPGM